MSAFTIGANARRSVGWYVIISEKRTGSFTSMLLIGELTLPRKEQAKIIES